MAAGLHKTGRNDAQLDQPIEDKEGINALMSAIRNGREDVLALQLEKEADVNYVSEDGDTLLMLAIKHGRSKAVKLLLEKGSNVNSKSDNGYTPLMLGLKHGRYDTVKLLLDEGSDVNTVSVYGYSPLMLALKYDHVEAVSILLKTGSDVRFVSPEGKSLLGYANSRYCPELVRYGLDLTSSRRDDRRLHIAVRKRQTDMVRFLVMNGFPALDLQLARTGLLSPLAVSIMVGRPDIAKYLILNRVLTPGDVTRLSWDPKPLRTLCNKRDHGETASVTRRAQELLDILRFLSSRPRCLRDLCLIAISSVLSQDFVRDPPGLPESQDRWLFQPTFRERVDLLEIPPSLKRELLHETLAAATTCCCWKDIVIGDTIHIPESCGRCQT